MGRVVRVRGWHIPISIRGDRGQRIFLPRNGSGTNQRKQNFVLIIRGTFWRRCGSMLQKEALILGDVRIRSQSCTRLNLQKINREEGGEQVRLTKQLIAETILKAIGIAN